MNPIKVKYARNHAQTRPVTYGTILKDCVPGDGGKSDCTYLVIGPRSIKVIEPSVRQMEGNPAFWENRVTDIVPAWFTFRGCRFEGEAVPVDLAFQVVGHYKSLSPENISSRTISDGTVFRLKADAKRYAKERMHPGAQVRYVVNPSEYHQPADFSCRRHVTVHLEDGDRISTEINGTSQTIRDYYEGQVFNVGTTGDLMKKAVRVEFNEFI